MSLIVLSLDTESKHFESTVNQIMDSIGEIGGIFELMFGVLTMIYGKIRKSLYYHSIIDELHAVKKDNTNDKGNIKDDEPLYQSRNVAARDEFKKLDHENNRLLNNLFTHKIKYDPNNRLENYFQDQIEQIRRQGIVNRNHQVDMINQMCRII